MIRKLQQQVGHEISVIGGIDLPAQLVSDDSDVEGDVSDDDLGRQAFWLLKLHEGAVSLKFRQSDLASMDDDTKRQLIADIQYALGIEPLAGEIL